VAKHFSGMQNGTKFAKMQKNSKVFWPGPNHTMITNMVIAIETHVKLFIY